jgi:hypothetical protein
MMQITKINSVILGVAANVEKGLTSKNAAPINHHTG